MLSGDLIHEGGETLRGGVARFSDALRERHKRFLVDCQNADGGWGGRAGPSDIYYTSFALRTADLVCGSEEAMWGPAAGFLREAPRPSGVVEAFCRLASWAAMPKRVAVAPECPCQILDLLAPFSKGGGYAHDPDGPPSVYMTFLAARCHGLGGARGNAAEAAAFVLTRLNPDGGFGDTGAESGVNPTAAGVLLLKAGESLSPEVEAATTAYLIAAQRADGGFGAHHAAPTSDLLSTYAALVAMDALGRARDLRLADAARFLKRLALPNGGFVAVPGDSREDIEYAYYGLAALAMLMGTTLRAKEGEGR